MRFDEILPLLREGRAARREAWDQQHLFVKIVERPIGTHIFRFAHVIHDGEFVTTEWPYLGVLTTDFLAEDWRVVG